MASRTRTPLPPWSEMLSLLQSYADREGHACVPYKHREQGLALGHWVYMQRRGRRVGTLSQRRQRSLRHLPGWSWNPGADRWETRFKALTRYAKREGHAGVPCDHIEDGLKLGSWASTQRIRYHQGFITAEQQQRLERLPGWQWERRSKQWRVGLRHLQHYARKHGHSAVPQEYTVRGYVLGRWVNSQRNHRADLAPDQIADLERLPGWAWNLYEAQWERAYHHLLVFAEKNGHAVVPTDHEQAGIKLGQWVARQRFAHGRRKLDKERADRLRVVKGWRWEARG